MNLIVLLLILGSLVSCVPASRNEPVSRNGPTLRNEWIEDDKIPLASTLTFPMTKFVEKVTADRSPFPEFNFAVGKAVNVDQYIYNIPELGEVIAVSFFPSSEQSTSWSVGIFYPKIKPEQLFEIYQIGDPHTNTLGIRRFEVISGSLKGACVSDYNDASNYQPSRGFSRANDHAILIYSKSKNSVSYCN